MPNYSGLLRPRETRYIACVATRQEQAREFVRVVRELLDAAPNGARRLPWRGSDSGVRYRRQPFAAPNGGLHQVGASHPAFAKMGDQFTSAIGHRQGDTFVWTPCSLKRVINV